MQYAKQAPELFKPVRTENNFTELYVDGSDCLNLLLREIKKARYFIHVQVMLFYSDHTGHTLANALAEKAKEGVAVRVMSDSQTSRISRAIELFRSSGTSHFSHLEDMFTESGVKFVPSDKETYMPTEWDKERAELQKKGVPEEFLVMQDAIQAEVLLNANVVDHRKVLIFDGETAVVTSMNLGDRYLLEEPTGKGPDRERKCWHDGAVLIKGPCVSVLNKHFASKWMVRGGDVFDYQKHYRTEEEYGSDVCTVYSYFPGMEINEIREFFIQKLKTCKGQLIVENPYMSDEVFWKELSQLNPEQAKKIILINPYTAPENDYAQHISAIKCHMFTPFLQGVSLFNYCRRMSHWKILLDTDTNEVFTGSYNLNHRSALHDFELNVLIESPQLARQVKKALEQDMAESILLTDANEFHQYPDLHPSCLLLRATDYFA